MWLGNGWLYISQGSKTELRIFQILGVGHWSIQAVQDLWTQHQVLPKRGVIVGILRYKQGIQNYLINNVTSFKFFNDHHKNINNTNSIRTNILYYIIIHVIAIIIKNVTIMLSLT